MVHPEEKQQQITDVANFNKKKGAVSIFYGEQNVNSIMKCWHALSKEMSSMHEKNYAKW